MSLVGCLIDNTYRLDTVVYSTRTARDVVTIASLMSCSQTVVYTIAHTGVILGVAVM